MSARRQFRVFALGACSFAGFAFGQSEPEGRITADERARSRNYASATFDAVVDRAMPSPAMPPGLVRSPQPSAALQASLLAESLVEDAGYRVEKTIESLVGEGFEPEDIIDGDWTRVANAKAIPYRATCQIEIDWRTEGEPNGHGTAFFVGKRVLLTAGHCIWGRDQGRDWASTITVIPARKGHVPERDWDPFGFERTATFSVHSKFLESEGSDLQYDIGWIILPDHKLFNRVEYHYGLRTTTHDELVRFDLRSNSYPDPLALRFRMYQDFEKQNQIVHLNMFYCFHDSLGGSSGGPLYVTRGGENQVVGVHSHTQLSPYKAKGATRITASNLRETNVLKQKNK